MQPPFHWSSSDNHRRPPIASFVHGSSGASIKYNRQIFGFLNPPPPVRKLTRPPLLKELEIY